jgi:hypothetical protein
VTTVAPNEQRSSGPPEPGSRAQSAAAPRPPELLRRAGDQEREGVGAEGERAAAERVEPGAERGQERVAGGVAALGVEAAEVVDVEREQEQRAAGLERADVRLERLQEAGPCSERGMRRPRHDG